MLKQVISRHGMSGLIRALIYPISTFITTPFRLIQSLWNCRILLKGNWSSYPHFSAHKALNSLFYWNRALNLKRFGRSGRSPYLGLGNYNLARCFHYTLPSLNSYWRAPTVVLLLGMGFWLGSYWVFQGETPQTWFLLAMILTLFSTEFYNQTFNQQNYNVVGWAFFPLLLFAMSSKLWMGVTVILLLISWGSFTLVFIGVLLLFVAAIVEMSLLPILASIPAVLKTATQFLPLFKKEGKGVLASVMKAIGMSSKKARYVRKSKKLDLNSWYRFILLVQFIIVVTCFSEQLPWVMFFTLGIYLLNSLFIRFADEQTISMLGLSTALFVVLNCEVHYPVLMSYWLLASPLPFVAGYYYNKMVLDIVPVHAPFDISPYRKAMADFIGAVPQKEKVYMAFDNPVNSYEKVFDGYRQLIELPAYESSVQYKLFFPEWWGVFELNFEGAPEIWGREPHQVSQNLEYWNCSHVIIYQEEKVDLDLKWSLNGFKRIGTFRWSDFALDFADHKNIQVDGLTWFLLKKESNSSA